MADKDCFAAEEETAAAEAETKQERSVRHTISAEETFTLAKDVFDLRCFFKNIYANRAVIARRLNIFSLACSIVFTLIYVGYIVWSAVSDRLLDGLRIAVYCLVGVYAVLIIVLVVVGVLAGKATTRTVKKYNKALKIFRLCVRLVSIAMAIIAIAFDSGGESPFSVAFEIVLITISIICIIVQAVPLLFGGITNLARWAISPAKGRTRFSVVLLEWYALVSNSNGEVARVRKISPRFLNDIDRCIDGYLIPRLGKKYIMNIDAKDMYSATDSVPDDLREIAEGIFKNVFEYAEECGYVNTNPTRVMELGGSLEDEQKQKQKPRRGIKARLMNVGKKIGESIVKSYLDGDGPGND